MRLPENFEESEIVQNLRKTGLNVGVILQEPWAYMCGVDKSIKPCSRPGMGIEFTDSICDRLRVTCRYIVQNITDKLLDTHATLAKRILYNPEEVVLDTALPILVETPDQRVTLDFTMPVFYLEHGVLIKTQYMAAHTEFFYVMKPFSLTVWMILIMSILSVSLLDALFRLVFTPVRDRHVSKYFQHTESSWLMTFGILLSRGMDIPIPNFSRRVLMVTWGLSCIIICNVYSAQLVSTKVALKIQSPFTNLEGLAEKLAAKTYRLKVYSPDSRFVHQVLENDNGPYANLRQAMRVNKPEFVDNLTGIISEIVKSTDNLALFASEYTLKAIAETNCNVSIIKMGITDFGSFAFTEANYAYLFTKVVLTFKERGYYLERLEHKYSYGRDCETRKEANTATGDKDDMQTVEIGSLQIVFWTLLLGSVLAMFGFAFEVAYHRCKKNYALDSSKSKLSKDITNNHSHRSKYNIFRHSIYDGTFYDAYKP